MQSIQSLLKWFGITADTDAEMLFSPEKVAWRDRRLVLLTQELAEVIDRQIGMGEHDRPGRQRRALNLRRRC